MNFYSESMTYIHYLRKINQIKRKYNDIVSIIKIGETVLKRNIYGIKIGKCKNQKLLVGAIHAQEWITSLVLFKYIEDICYCLKYGTKVYGQNIKKCLQHESLIIIPMLNIDGVEVAVNGIDSAYHLKDKIKEYMKADSRSWQANANGIDLNHNFNAGFEISRLNEIKMGINSPRSRQYGGEYYHSEPEVKSLVNYCKKNNISMVFAFHSQGEEIFYEYGEKTPIISKYIAKILSECSFYKISKQKNLASHAGFKDWFITYFRKPGFTIEIGKGTNPLPISKFNDIYYRIRKMMFCIITF